MDDYWHALAAWVHKTLAEAVQTKAPGLRSAGFAEKLPHQYVPLPIQAQVGNEQSSSFRAPWNQTSARVAMTTTGRYEAGGNAMWLSVTPEDAKERIIAGRTACMEEIDEIATQFFTVTLRSGTDDGRTWERLVFPDLLPVGVLDKATIYAKENWLMDLPLVSGHCFCRRGTLI